MKASLVSATSVIALLALESAPASAATIFTVSPNPLNFGDSLVGLSLSGKETAQNNIPVANTITWGAATAPFGPTSSATATITGTSGAASTATFTYTFTPSTRGAATSTVTVTGVRQTFTVSLTGTGVAPVQSVTTSTTTYALVNGPSTTSTVTISNVGDGSKALNGTTTQKQLNGSTSGISGSAFFGGSSGGTYSLKDSNAGATTSTFVYTYQPTIRGVTTASVVSTFTNGNSSGNNTAQTVTSVVTGQGVAPVESMAGGNAGYTLVGQSNVASVTVANSGDGNKSGLGAVSNLNGSIGGPAGSSVFSGPSPNPNPLSLTDTSSTTVNYVFTPTTRGIASATVTGSFSNGSPDNKNLAHSNSAVITGQGVAPVQNTDTAANAGYVLVGTSKSLSYTVRNTGDGNLATGGPNPISNLNGSVSNAGLSGDPEFAGPSPNPTTFSLADTSSTTVSMVFAPTVKGAPVSASVTTTFSNGNALGNNQADSATTVLTGQGVAPVNSISSTVAAARIGGAGGSGSVTVANVGNGNLATGGADPSSNLQVTGISGPSGGGFSGSGSGGFTLPDTTSSAVSSTTATYTYNYAAAKGTARGTYTNTVVTTFANGSTDGTNSAGSINTTVSGQAVGPKYLSTYGTKSGPVNNPWSTPGPISKQGIGFGTLGVSGSKTIFLDIANATLDPGDDALTGLDIGSFTLTGDTGNFAVSGFTPTLLHSATNGGGVLEVAINFTASGAGSYTGDLQFTTDQEAAFGDTASGDVFDYALFASATVPEPGTWLILGAGLGGLAAVRRRRRAR